MADDQQTTTIDFTQPLPTAAPASASAPSIDFSKPPAKNDVGEQGAFDKWWSGTLLGKVGVAAKDISDWFGNRAAKNRQENQAAIAAGKEPPHREATNTALDMLSSYGRFESGATDPKNLAIAGGVIAANTNPMTGIPVDIALAGHGTYNAVKAAPKAFAGNPEASEKFLLGSAEAVGGAAGAAGQTQTAFTRYSPVRTVKGALGRKLTPTEADAPRAGGQIQPALNNTPREVLEHAAQEGIKLTPGQATEDGLAQNLQKTGVNAATGGKELAAAIAENKTKFGQSVNGFMDRLDPKRSGMSAESAGEAIQQSAETAKSVAHDNATQGYQKIDYLMDRPVQPDSISKTWNTVKQNLPTGAEDQILAQTPRSMRAVVEDMLSGNPEGFKPTFNQSVQLRSLFRDLGEADGMPDKTQAAFRQMTKAVDSAMESTANGMNAGDEWRAANAGWKDYATKYGDRQSVLYKTLKQSDPTKVVTTLQNSPATDIETLRQEGMDSALEPLRRQVVQDIAKSRFNIAHDGLGGYSDSYLRSLFSPADLKELYLKADLANRLKYDPNPSGTAGGLQSLEQLTLGNQAKMGVAAKLSMPRDPLSFLPQKAQATIRTTPFNSRAAVAPSIVSPITGGQLARPDDLFKQAVNQ